MSKNRKTNRQVEISILNKMYEDEAKKIAHKFLMEFAEWVWTRNSEPGLANRETVEGALQNSKLVEQFWNERSIKKLRNKKTSTKKIAAKKFDDEFGTTIQEKIYFLMKENDAKLSRSDISTQYGFRFSTVCGQVAELLAAGKLVVVGIKKDSETGHLVEVLKAV